MTISLPASATPYLLHPQIGSNWVWIQNTSAVNVLISQHQPVNQTSGATDAGNVLKPDEQVFLPFSTTLFLRTAGDAGGNINVTPWQ